MNIPLGVENYTERKLASLLGVVNDLHSLVSFEQVHITSLLRRFGGWVGLQWREKVRRTTLCPLSLPCTGSVPAPDTCGGYGLRHLTSGGMTELEGGGKVYRSHSNPRADYCHRGDRVGSELGMTSQLRRMGPGRGLAAFWGARSCCKPQSCLPS